LLNERLIIFNKEIGVKKKGGERIAFAAKRHQEERRPKSLTFQLGQ
jgi:hypothetical protein